MDYITSVHCIPGTADCHWTRVRVDQYTNKKNPYVEGQ